MPGRDLRPSPTRGDGSALRSHRASQSPDTPRVQRGDISMTGMLQRSPNRAAPRPVRSTRAGARPRAQSDGWWDRMLGFLSPTRRHAAQKAAVAAQRQSLLDAQKRTRDSVQSPGQAGQGGASGPDVPAELSVGPEYEEEGGVEDSESLHEGHSTTGRGAIPTDAETVHSSTASGLQQTTPGASAPGPHVPGFQFQDNSLLESHGVHDSPTIRPRLSPRAASQGHLRSSGDASAVALQSRSLSELIGTGGLGPRSSVDGGSSFGLRGISGSAGLQSSSFPLLGSASSEVGGASTDSPKPLPRRGQALSKKPKSQTHKPSRLHQEASLELFRGSDTPGVLTRGRSSTRQGDSFIRELGGRRVGPSKERSGLSEGGRGRVTVGRHVGEDGLLDAAANILSVAASREEMAAFLSGESDGAASWRLAYGTSVSELQQMSGLEQGLRELRASIAAAAGGPLSADGGEFLWNGAGQGIVRSPREMRRHEEALRPLQLLHHAGFVELQLHRLAVDHAAVMATQSLKLDGEGGDRVGNAEVAALSAEDLAAAAVATILEEKMRLQEDVRRGAVAAHLGMDGGGSSLASSNTWDAEGLGW